MERTGSIRKSMDTAHEVLRGGKSMVVFPEGTRSVTGEMADFLPSLGYLALRAQTGVLPAHVSGTFEALPKGAALPRARELCVSFGPFLSVDWLTEATAGLPGQEAWRFVSAFVQRVVENLRDGVATTLDIEGARGAWDGKRLGPITVRVARTARRRLLRSLP
jgi:long-chain acyl-CoA synthetase